MEGQITWVTERYWPQNGSKLGYSPTNWMLNWMVNTKHDQYLEYLTISESPVLTNVQTCPLCLMSVLVHSCPMTLICQALLRHTRRILCSRAACRVQRSAQAFSCMLLVREGWPQPATRCPRIKRKPDHLSTVDASLSLCGCYFGLGGSTAKRPC